MSILFLSMLLVAADGSEQPPTTPSISIRTATVASNDAFSEPQYQELLRCTLAKNASAVEAFIDTRFELGGVLASKFEQDTRARVGPKQLFDGCFEFKTQSGTFPFSFDRLVADWAARFDVKKSDPNTFDKQQGVMRVHDFAAYVSCVQLTNSDEDILLFLSAPLNTTEAVEKFNNLGEKCWPEEGVSLRFGMASLADALKEKGAED